MKYPHLIAFIILMSCSLIFAQSDGEISEASKTNIKKLVNQLGDADYEQREEASEKLIKIGNDIIPILTEYGLNHKDIEIKKRVRDILSQLQTENALSSYIKSTGWDKNNIIIDEKELVSDVKILTIYKHKYSYVEGPKMFWFIINESNNDFDPSFIKLKCEFVLNETQGLVQFNIKRRTDIIPSNSSVEFAKIWPNAQHYSTNIRFNKISAKYICELADKKQKNFNQLWFDDPFVKDSVNFEVELIEPSERENNEALVKLNSYLDLFIQNNQKSYLEICAKYPPEIDKYKTTKEFDEACKMKEASYALEKNNLFLLNKLYDKIDIKKLREVYAVCNKRIMSNCNVLDFSVLSPKPVSLYAIMKKLDSDPEGQEKFISSTINDVKNDKMNVVYDILNSIQTSRVYNLEDKYPKTLVKLCKSKEFKEVLENKLFNSDKFLYQIAAVLTEEMSANSEKLVHFMGKALSSEKGVFRKKAIMHFLSRTKNKVAIQYLIPFLNNENLERTPRVDLTFGEQINETTSEIIIQIKLYKKYYTGLTNKYPPISKPMSDLKTAAALAISYICDNEYDKYFIENRRFEYEEEPLQKGLEIIRQKFKE